MSPFCEPLDLPNQKPPIPEPAQQQPINQARNYRIRWGYSTLYSENLHPHKRSLSLSPETPAYYFPYLHGSFSSAAYLLPLRTHTATLSFLGKPSDGCNEYKEPLAYSFAYSTPIFAGTALLVRTGRRGREDGKKTGKEASK